MKDHEGAIRGFYRVSKAWYSRDDRDIEVMFGMYYPNDGGGTSGEMAMRWHDLDGLVPRLEVYCDAWSALKQFTDILAELADRDGENIPEEEFVSILLQHGVKDLTEYESQRANYKRKSLEMMLHSLKEQVKEIEGQLVRL